MKPNQNTIYTNAPDQTSENWFDDVIATIRSHQLLLDSGVADQNLQKVYSAFINQDADAIHTLSRETSNRYLISKMIFEFVKNLKESQKLPAELALQLSQNGVNVWAVVNDDDELAERSLILSAAKTNANYVDLGLRIDTTIIEQSDNFPIPEQFKKVIFTT